MGRYTTYLYASPSVLEGAGRTLDLWGAFEQYNDVESPNEADARAIARDWMAVGHDLLNAATDATGAHRAA